MSPRLCSAQTHQLRLWLDVGCWLLPGPCTSVSQSSLPLSTVSHCLTHCSHRLRCGGGEKRALTCGRGRTVGGTASDVLLSCLSLIHTIHKGQRYLNRGTILPVSFPSCQISPPWATMIRCVVCAASTVHRCSTSIILVGHDRGHCG